MKRHFPLLILFALALSACTIRFEVGVAINEDESGTFSLFMGVDEELKELAAQGTGEELDFTEGLEDVPEDWTVEPLIEDGFEGVRVSADFDSLEDLERRLGELGDTADTGVGTDFLSDFGLTHEGDEFRFKVDVSGLDEGMTEALGEGGGEDLFSGMDPTALFEDLFEIRFKLTLPGEIGQNNADEVDGNTLIWNVDLADEGGTYEAVSSTGGGSNALLLGAAAVAAVAVAGVGVTVVRRRRAEATAAAIDAAPVSAEAPPVDPLEAPPVDPIVD